MKRFVAILIVFILGVLIYVANNNSLTSCVLACGYDNFEVVRNDSCEVICIYGDNIFHNIIKDLSVEIHDQQTLADRVIIEGYSHNIDDYILVNGVKTNVQISICGNSMIIGSPLIPDSF